MTVRHATLDDAGAVAQIVNALIRDTAVTFNCEERAQAHYEGLIAAGQPFWVVEDYAGLVVGYATYFRFRGGVGYAHTREHSIALSEAAQGQGLGRKLMAALEDHARKHAIHTLIGGVSGENLGSVDFHEKLGFEVVGTLPQVGRKFNRWMDLILVQKML